MKTQGILRIILGMVLVLSSLAWAGHETGSAGDELRFIFQEGKMHATERLSKIKRCSFDSNTKESTKNWILENRSKLISDLVSSEHVWITDNQATCAFTQTSANYPITLSFLACKNITDKSMAGRLLTHESVHHQGISQEDFADEVALAVYSANLGLECPDPSNDPFDPLSCQVKPCRAKRNKGTLSREVFVSEVVGDITLFYRYRTCTQNTGCTAWSVDDPNKHEQLGIAEKHNRNDEHWLYDRLFLQKQWHPNLSESINQFHFTYDGSVKFHIRRLLTFGYGSSPSDYDFWAYAKDNLGQISVPADGSSLVKYDQTDYYNAYYFILGDKVNAQSPNLNSIVVPLDGRLTNHCMRLAAKNRLPNTQNRIQWIENEAVLLSRF